MRVHFESSRGTVHAVDGVSYGVRRGEIVALVGESGSGKSVSALAMMRLLPRTARVSGRVLFDGRDLLALPAAQMRALRGRDLAMIFQEPMTSLNPVLSIGLQLTEPLREHLGVSEARARQRAIELLTQVGITDPEHRLRQYPHQLSGGMRQRVMIAMALSCGPKLILADEPTTALDVTIQAQILDLLRDLSRRLGIALVIITHNLGIVARYADRVNVMYAAKLAEQAAAAPLFATPRHFYTLGLLRSIPRIDRGRTARLATIDGLPPDLRELPPGCRFAPRCAARIAGCENPAPLAEIAADHHSACIRAQDVAAAATATTELGARRATRVISPLLEIEALQKHFGIAVGPRVELRTPVVRAVDDVSLAIGRGETLGLVGESGCGKTTIGRLIVGLETPTAGRIRFEGREIAGDAVGDFLGFRHRVQMVFQDPYSSLNPRMSVGAFIAEPLLVHRLVPSRAAARVRVTDLLGQVGLYPYMAERYPHELSGGQRQRVGIARALALEPSLIVCDEPVSALDVSIQGQVINLLESLRERLGLSLLFISHDLAVVRHISDRVAVMYLGRIVEIADRDTLYDAPRHPYTRALLDAVPVPDPAVEAARRPSRLKGEIPSPLDPPPGCVFHTRCPIATERCRLEAPLLRELSPGHRAACHNIADAAA
ncbi:MAG TPA: ABC transporter ATP-binding protein [Stellaceae bacterium]|nr:ABC transporter ATP-binding protein [Stellaceae bacterium]